MEEATLSREYFKGVNTDTAGLKIGNHHAEALAHFSDPVLVVFCWPIFTINTCICSDDNLTECN